MIFKLSISDIQHVFTLDFAIDLSEHKVTCIVGKNSVGKTTLIRAIANFKSADIFKSTASPYIFTKDSKIEYEVDSTKYTFKYDKNNNTLDTKEIIDESLKNMLEVELPIPNGKRFKFERLGKIDSELRSEITKQTFEEPKELIDFLSKIYGSTRFESLKEITVKKEQYYFILKKDDLYIREDYLSSGEYFIINLYKLIKKRKKLIVIDEIDISLDASAQVNLLDQLRLFCKEYKINILFTTQSLALMKTFSIIGEERLLYMENNDGIVSLTGKSYNYVKAEMYGFKGWDRYILTEDKLLKKYLTYLLEGESGLLEYIIIYIGTADSTVDLMKRNRTDNFFANTEHVVTVLDKDQLRNHEDKAGVYFIPFESIEKKVYELYLEKDSFVMDSINNLRFEPDSKDSEKAKVVYKNLKKSDQKVFMFLETLEKSEVNKLRKKLVKFLTLTK